MDFKSMMEVMQACAREAGALMLSAITSQDLNESHDKSNTKDFVTVADIKSQDILRKALREHYPDAVILSEEDDETERQTLYQAGFSGFVLDPIDGTYNFKHDMRESAISIGYIEDGESVAGVIYDPYKDEMFAAAIGQGASRNGQLIHVSTQTELFSASVATSNGYDSAGLVRNLERQIGIHAQTGSMPWTSCPGSGVLAMAWVACGRIDAFHHNSMKPWDNAASFVLVSEAGGVIEALDGQSASFITPAILVGSPAIQTQLRTIFNNLPQELLH
jgi:myo-inositol-1(or 4)-monophosphatase